MDVSSAADMEAAIGDLLAPWDSPDTPGWAVAVVREGEQVARVCRGMASVEHGAPITPSTVFSMASISKQFVCASILLLEERGLIELDDDIRRYVPELPEYGNEVTLRHLMTNTSGLRDIEGLLHLAGFRFGSPLEHDEVMALICRQRELVCPPGEEYLYCNTGFRLLAMVIERATGQRWDEFMDTDVLGPTGMVQSRICVDRRAVQRHLASAYDKRSNGYRRLEGLLPMYAVAESGESGLYSTLDDMTRWAMAFQGVGPLAAVAGRLATTRPLATGAPGNYGYGVFSLDWAGKPVVRHSGGMPGVHGEILHLPDERLTVVCLANHEDAAPTLVARRVVASMVGDLDPAYAALPPGLAGRYVDPATGIVVETGVKPDPTFIFDWSLNLDQVGPGRLASFSSWLALELPAADGGDATPRSVTLGGRPLELRRVEPDAEPPMGLAGRYESAELKTDWIIEPGLDGLRVVIEGPYGRIDRGRLVGGGPDLAIAIDGDRPWASVRRDGASRQAQLLTIATAAVRGVTLTRTAP